ncbi:DUF5998 family protein [Buchananella hordeovulneris]|uniref:Phosphodiesterase n=1 Tax=Buchananella hordeovulneris TaxID=52770 RepID=A0A1Q5PY10_9ACTO|nr:DUF5998 family protein [Buchananella hordeovulneris]OKL52494.1 hypothetical protein BSZ40_03290 [Buchananella hordeovulneris]
MNQRLLSELANFDYYPRAAARMLDLALAGESVADMLVQQSTSIDDEAVRRHLNAMVLTPTRLLLLHVDDLDDEAGAIVVSTDAVALSEISALRVSHGLRDPEGPHGGELTEVTLSIGWRSTRQIEVQPKSCGDPECVAEHGWGGVLLNEDVMVRVTAAADGAAQVRRTSEFAAQLARATAGKR